MTDTLPPRLIDPATDRRPPTGEWRGRRWLRSSWVLLVLMAAGAAAAVAVRYGVFPFFSADRDEPIYVLQAKTLLHGHLTLPRSPDLEFFQPWLTGVRGDKVFFEFPPGYAVVIAVSLLFTGSVVPALAAVAATAVLAMYLLAREASGRKDVALVAAAMLIASPMVLIQSGVFLSYLFTLCLGLFVGWIFLTRPFDALLWGIPFVVYVMVVTAVRGSGVDEVVRRAVWIAVGFVPLALVMAAYNAYITGSLTTFPIEAADPLNTFGFGTKRLMPGAPEIVFSKHDSFDAIGQNYRSAPAFVFGGFVGIALALAGIYFARRRAATYALLGLVATFTFGYFFYWGIALMATGAPLFGPQYYLPMIAPMVVLGATTLVALWNRQRIVTGVLVVVLVALSVSYFKDKVHMNRVLSVLWYEHQHDAYERFDGTNALVFLPNIDPFLLTDLPFASNNRSLTGEKLYAVDRGAENVEFLARSSRTPYRLFTTFRDQAHSDELRTESDVVRLELQRAPQMTLRAHITNTTESPVVTAYLDTGGGADEVVVDRASHRGATYDVEWTVAAPDHGGGDVTTLVPGPRWVTVGTRFDGGAVPNEVFENRYATSVHDDEILLVTPPRRYALATSTLFGRLLFESPPSPAFNVTVTP
jgi:hypothetical protein